MGFIAKGCLQVNVIVAVFENNELVLNQVCSVPRNDIAIEVAVLRNATGQHGKHGLPKLAHDAHCIFGHPAGGSPNANPVTFFQVAQEKIYLTGAFFNNAKPGDIVLIYRMSDEWYKRYSSVVTGTAIIQSITQTKDVEHCIKTCKNRSIFIY